jgi:hypothetical protein
MRDSKLSIVMLEAVGKAVHQLFGFKQSVKETSSKPKFNFESREVNVLDLIQNSADPLTEKPCSACRYFRPTGVQVIGSTRELIGHCYHDSNRFSQQMTYNLRRGRAVPISRRLPSCGAEGVFFKPFDHSNYDFINRPPEMFSWA